MNRDEKAAVIEEVAEGLGGAQAVFAIDYRGISVSQSAELRSKLREADASFSIVKNRLAKLAAEKAGAAELNEHLVGPTALTLVNGDIALAAKAIAGFTKEHQLLTFKAGLMEGTFLDADQFTALAKLPGVDQLRAQLVGVAASPITGVVRTLNALIGGLASQLGQISDQGLIGEGSAAGPVAADAPSDEPEGSSEDATAAPPAEDAPAEEAPVETSEEESETEPEPDEPEEAPAEEAEGADEPAEDETETQEETD
jgi:large subunit ribosomal protein L10